MPEELRNLGDLYIKQEFRLHLDQATEDQMTKFLGGWRQYEAQLQSMDMSTRKKVRESVMDPKLDEMIKDKLNQEQMETLKDFKDTIYDSQSSKKWLLTYG